LKQWVSRVIEVGKEQLVLAGAGPESADDDSVHGISASSSSR
jgi:hypothetical protein